MPSQKLQRALERAEDVRDRLHRLPDDMLADFINKRLSPSATPNNARAVYELQAALSEARDRMHDEDMTAADSEIARLAHENR